MPVRGVVVGDQMQRLVLGRLGIDLLEKFHLLDMGVLLLALTDDLTFEHVEPGEQRGGALAFVVVRHRGRAAVLHQQARLRAIQCLHLALLVAAQHQGVLGRGRVQLHEMHVIEAEFGLTEQFLRLQTIQNAIPPLAVRPFTFDLTSRRCRCRFEIVSD